MPKVSIIVPNYNHAKFLKQRLESIFNQTFQNFEVILLDDCSNDNSIEILNEYIKNPKVSHFIKNKKNSGSTFKQWKKGLELAKGEYIWIAESDDWADVKFLEELILISSKDNKISLAYCRSYRANEKGENLGINNWGENKNPERWKNDFINTGKYEVENYLKYRNTIPNTSAILLKKEVILFYINHIMNYKYCGDWLLWALIISERKIAYLSKPLNYFRRYKNATSLKEDFKVIKSRIAEYKAVIFEIKNIYKITIKNKEQQWIIEEWKNSRKYFSKRQYLFPPFHLSLKFLFYKQLLKSQWKKLFAQ